MMLKVNNEYISLPDPPQVVRRAKTPDLLDAAGDFSYSFSLPNTAETRRKLGILDLNTFDIDAELTSKGHSVHIGTLSVEKISQELKFSFTSGNTEWFAMLGNSLVSDIPIEFTDRFKFPVVNTSPSAPLIASWTNTEGIVFPLVDIGDLRDNLVQRLNTNDFFPMVYIRDVMTALFQSNGLKLSGELLNDGLYNQLVAGSAGGRASAGLASGIIKYVDGMGVLVGKTVQTINTTPQKVLFTLDTLPYYNGTFTPWDTSLSRYQNIGFEFDASFRANFNFSASVTWTITLRKNGSIVTTKTGTGDSVSEVIGGANLNPNDYLEVWASVSAGTVDILPTSSLKVTFVAFDNYYPQYFLGKTTQADFVKSVFTMFNVIASYDKYTKTVTCNLFENISSREPKDLSQYVVSYELDSSDVLTDLAKDIIFKHQESESEEVQELNEVNDLPFAAGQISPDRSVLSGTKDIETIFTATKDYFNERLRAILMDLGINEYTPSDEATIDFTSVADDGAGIALFTTSADHNFNQGQYITISNTNTGEYLGRGVVGAIPATNQFKISFLAFAGTATGDIYQTSASSNANPETIFIAAYFPNLAVSDFSFNSTINYVGTTYTNVAWAYFLKESFSLEVDKFIKTAAFGQTNGYFSIPLLQSYYRLYAQSINKPVKCVAQLLIPEKVYMELDFAEPIILNTPEFSYRFFYSKDTGYIGSEFLCEFELIKLS